MITLCIIHAHFLQFVEDFFRFDEFGDRQDVEVLAEPDQVVHQSVIDLGVEDVAHEGAIELDVIEMQFPQVMEGIISASEVVQREGEPFFLRSDRNFLMCVMSPMASRSRISKTTT